MTPAPYSPPLEKEWLPDRAAISDAIRRVVSAG
jgi:pyruvate/2-oxoglutarate/acetoin dehydrogenase E1 component